MGHRPHHHAWKRFWCRRDKRSSLSDAELLDAGFLLDPESEFGRKLRPEAVSLEQLDSASCLVLLGEPGMGKSTALADERDRVAAAGAMVHDLELRRASSHEELRRVSDLAVHSTTGPSFLFLDGLDEGIGRNASLPEHLAEVLRQCDRTSLRLRISCRSLEWPSRFEDRLRELWPDPDAVGVYELLPLRRVDIRIASEDYQITSEAFIEAVRDRDATSLAIHPISLRFLLEMYASQGTLPHSKLQLFAEGALLLCSEEGTWHHGGGRSQSDAARRRAIAARIAAVNTFTNRHIVTRKQKTDNDLLVAEMEGGTEGARGARYDVTVQALEDTLTGTALFSASLPDGFAWTHQSYREFLAAWYLGHRDLDLDTVASLYFPGGEHTRVPGPLREVAAWHATLVPALLELLVHRDPEVLLHSDSAATSPASRKQLVDALLHRMDDFEAIDSHYWEKDYRKLSHDELASQLRPYIRATSKNLIVRRVAMDIAWSCGVRDLVPDFGAVLEDPTEDIYARECAARALSHLSGDTARTVLGRVLAGGLAFDVGDEIRGMILDALWPEHIDASNLFQVITDEKRPNHFAGYARFLHELPSRVPLAVLPAALEWIEQTGDREQFDSIGRVQAQILSRALNHLDDAQVLASVARIVGKSLKSHIGLFGDFRSQGELSFEALTQDRRHALLDALIRIDPDDDQLGGNAVVSEPPLLRVEDLTWLAEVALTEGDRRIQAALGRLAKALYAHCGYPTDPHVEDMIARTMEQSEAFRAPLSDLFAPIDLESAAADRLREEWSTTQANITRRVVLQEKASTARMEFLRGRLQIVRKALVQIEAGAVDRWISLCQVLMELEHAAIQDTEEGSELAGYQERIVRAAAAFLNSATPPSQAWMDDNAAPPDAIAARAGFVLIGSKGPDALAILSDDAWRHWGAVMLAVLWPTCPNALRVELTNRAYDRGLENVIDAVRRVALRQNRQVGVVGVFDGLPLPLPDRLQIEILNFVEELGDRGYGDALTALIASGSEAARKRARETLAAGPASRAAHAAGAALFHDAPLWEAVLQRMEVDRDFVVAMSEVLAQTSREPEVFATLDEHATARLFLVMLRSFPPAADPRRDRRGVITARDNIARLRSRLMQMLVEKGSSSALAELEWLVAQEPGNDVLKWQLVRAKEIFGDGSWAPMGVADFLKMVRVLGATIILQEGEPSCFLVFGAGTLDALRANRIVEFLSAKLDGIAAQVRDSAVAVDGSPEALGRMVELAESGAITEAAVGARLLGIRRGDEWMFEELPEIHPVSHGVRDVATDEMRDLLGQAQVVVATATDVETAAVLGAMEPLPGEDRLLEGSLDIVTYRVGLLGRYLVAHLQSAMGSTGVDASQPVIGDAIQEVDPKVVFMVGIAFGCRSAHVTRPMSRGLEQDGQVRRL